MKSLFTLFLLLSVTFIYSQTKIELKFSNNANTSVLYYVPTNGNYAFASRIEENVDALGNLVIHANIEEPGFFYLFPQLKHKNDGWQCIQVYAEPNDKIQIKVDANNPDDTEFSGAHALLNQFLAERERHFLLYISNTPHFNEMISSTEPEAVYNDLFSFADEEIKLLDKIDLDPQQYNYVKTDIQLYYKHAFYKGLLNHGVEDYHILSNWFDFITNTEMIGDHDKYHFASMWVNESLDLKKYFHQEKNLVQFAELGKVEKDQNTLDVAFSDEELKIYLANELIMNASHNQMDEVMLSRYSTFKQLHEGYPYFNKLYDAYNDQLMQLKDETEINLKEVKSIADLAKNFDTPYIFLDVWATWCSPCIKEFSKSKSLKSFITENKDIISMAYLAIDENKSSEEISRVINFNKLDGLQFHAIEGLRKELEEKLGSGTSISLPAFALIDNEGNIVLRTTSRPSQWESLHKELKAVL